MCSPHSVHHQHVSMAVAATISVTYKDSRQPNNLSKCVSATKLES